MNLIERLKDVAGRGYKSVSMDIGLGLQTWTIEELASEFTAQLSQMPDEDSMDEDVATTDYILDEWIVDIENGCIERLDYNGNRTGDTYKLH